MSAAAFSLQPPTGAAMLSRLDLSQPDIIRDAEAQLARCSTEADYASWALGWGDAVIARLHEVDDYDEIFDGRLKDADARTELEVVDDAVKAAAASIRDALNGPADEVASKIEAVLKTLEEA